ncbi:hypothetical protein Tco_1189863, partial [Tanacetum coccineum]
TDLRPVMEQYNELLGILGRFTQHKMNIDEAIQSFVIGNKANGSGINGLVDGSTNSLKGQNMFNKSPQVYYVTYVSEAYFVQDDDVAWWVDSGATMLLLGRCFTTRYQHDSLEKKDMMKEERP